MSTRKAPPAWLGALHTMIFLEKGGEDAEIVADGAMPWLGLGRITRATLDQLLWLMAVSATNEPGDMERYAINGIGRALIRRPELSQEIVTVVTGGGAWTIVDDRIVRMNDDGTMPEAAPAVVKSSRSGGSAGGSRARAKPKDGE